MRWPETAARVRRADGRLCFGNCYQECNCYQSTYATLLHPNAPEEPRRNRAERRKDAWVERRLKKRKNINAAALLKLAAVYRKFLK